MNKNISKQKEIKAEHNQARISASKVRMIAKMIKSYSAVEAKEQLKYIHKKGAGLLYNVLESAIANAQHNFGLGIESLQIKKIEVTEGATLRRWRARSRGMGNRINKRTCHIRIVLFSEEVVPEKSVTEKVVSVPEKKKEPTQDNENSKGEAKKKTEDTK